MLLTQVAGCKRWFKHLQLLLFPRFDYLRIAPTLKLQLLILKNETGFLSRNILRLTSKSSRRSVFDLMYLLSLSKLWQVGQGRSWRL